jgi:hypothetical protein
MPPLIVNTHDPAVFVPVNPDTPFDLYPEIALTVL